MSYEPPLKGSEQDETNELRPKFNADGLVTAIAQDVDTGEVLMLAWMNEDALRATLDTGRGTYWRRSRQKLWIKGETSGHVQELLDFRVDCDRDCLLALVHQTGPACHTNRRVCFYTAIRDGAEGELMAPEAGGCAPARGIETRASGTPAARGPGGPRR